MLMQRQYAQSHLYAGINSTLKSMKKIIRTALFCVLAFAMATVQLSAKDAGDGAKSFRQTGYKGSVLYTNHYLVWQGVETSHGYMFNEHHYLGAGAGFMLAPIDNVPTFGRVFVDYNAYICKKRSTPTAGVKAGFCHALNYSSNCEFRNAAEIEPNIGWNWTLKSGNGLMLNVGCPVYLTKKSDAVSTYVMPKLSFGIEF